MALETGAGFAMSQNTYTAAQTRRAVFGWTARTSANTPGLISGGLLSGTDMQLSAAVSGLVVNISTGECLIGGTEATSQGGYYAFNQSQSSVTLATANGSNPRIDLICVTADDGQYTPPSGGTSNTVTIQGVTGTPTSGATLSNLSGAPALPGSSLLLGYVLVPTAATNLTSGDILNIATPVVASGLGSTTITSSGTLTAPGGAGYMMVTLVGGGGGGSPGQSNASANYGGGGGGGGQYVQTLAVAPKGTITATVGAGGSGGAGSTGGIGAAGAAGGSTSLTGTGLNLVAVGGMCGIGVGTAAGPYGGAYAGASTLGYVGYNAAQFSGAGCFPGCGAYGPNTSNALGGGPGGGGIGIGSAGGASGGNSYQATSYPGGSSPSGAGGAGGVGSTSAAGGNGGAGVGYGCGGGGGGGTSYAASAGGNGGAGANGVITIVWLP